MQPDNMQPQELIEKIAIKDPSLKLIDVRQPEEYTGELGHILGTELIALGTLPEQMARLDKNKTYIMICRSGARSAQAGAFLKQNGFTHVYNLFGGMLLWNQLNLPRQ